MGKITCALAALAAIGCAPPEDAWVGIYAGTYECLGAASDGAPYAEGPADQTVSIGQYSDGSLFQAGRGCMIGVRLSSPLRASYVPTTCPALTTPSGLRVIGSVQSGFLDFDDPWLNYTAEWRFEPEDRSWYVNARCTFEGRRSD